MAIRIKVRQNESVQQLLRRFKKLCEKEGLTKEVKKRQHYEKPSERARRERRRAINRYAMMNQPGQTLAGPANARRNDFQIPRSAGPRGRSTGPRTGGNRSGPARTGGPKRNQGRTGGPPRGRGR